MIPLYEDAGSGQLSDLSDLGVEGEPVIEKLIAGGADLVSFSGDKLLGAVQAGLIVGKRGIVDRLRRHPLYRALRSDKLRLAALEATLAAHQRNQTEVPVLQMLSLTKQEISTRAQSLLSQVSNNSKTSTDLTLSTANLRLVEVQDQPQTFPTTVIAVSDPNRTAQEIETILRTSLPPVIARIADQKVLLDLRTVFPDQEDSLLKDFR